MNKANFHKAYISASIKLFS